MKLHPFESCVNQAVELIEKGRLVHQQFLCAHCGTKLTMETPNRFFIVGTCEECSGVTNIREDGCNFMVYAAGPEAIAAALKPSKGQTDNG